MKRWMSLGLLLLVLAWDAPAQTTSALRKQLEGSMLLTGRIDLAADGTVTAYAIDRESEVQPKILAHIARHVPRWEVHPATVDGTPVASSSRFSMRLLARRHDDGDYRFGIASVHIEEDIPESQQVRSRGKLRPPVYPRAMADMGATGTVYVVVKVGRDGHVVDSHVERVDLTVLVKQHVATRIRQQFSRAALNVASEWAFTPASDGPGEGDDHYAVRVPVDFVIDNPETSYGAWVVYLPGEYMKAPWYKDEDGGNTAAVPGRPMLAGRGMRLLTGLEPGGT